MTRCNLSKIDTFLHRGRTLRPRTSFLYLPLNKLKDTMGDVLPEVLIYNIGHGDKCWWNIDNGCIYSFFFLYISTSTAPVSIYVDKHYGLSVLKGAETIGMCDLSRWQWQWFSNICDLKFGMALQFTVCCVPLGARFGCPANWNLKKKLLFNAY